MSTTNDTNDSSTDSNHEATDSGLYVGQVLDGENDLGYAVYNDDGRVVASTFYDREHAWQARKNIESYVQEQAADEGDYDLNAERLAAEEDDIIFAITREDQTTAQEFVTGFLIGIGIVAVLNVLHFAYTRTVGALRRGDDQ